MPLCTAAPVDVTEKQRQALEALVRQRQAPQSLVLRARIVLLANAGLGVRETAARLGIGRRTVQRWRERWGTSADPAVAERLSDAPRPGTPPTFTPEQICAIVALACASPSRGGHPLTHWTQADLAAEMSARGKYIRHGTLTLIADFDVATGRRGRSTTASVRPAPSMITRTGATRTRA